MAPFPPHTLSPTRGSGSKCDKVQTMGTSFFADQRAHAQPGSFDPRVAGTSVGLPPDVAELAHEIGAADTEEFAAYCSVFAEAVATRLHWHEADVSHATEQLYVLLGQPDRPEPAPLAFGARAPSAFAGLTARQLVAAKRQAG